jgi:uncharacterized protein (DUF302 family)
VLDGYTVATEKGFEEAVSSVLKIIEFCNADFATKLLRADVKTSLLMPCKTVLF